MKVKSARNKAFTGNPNDEKTREILKNIAKIIFGDQYKKNPEEIKKNC